MYKYIFAENQPAPPTQNNLYHSEFIRKSKGLPRLCREGSDNYGEYMPNIVFALCTLLTVFSHTVYADVEIVSVDLKPYSYEENGVVKGTSTEIVKAVLKNIDIDSEIQILPWPRSYDMALRGEDILIFPIMRTPLRENLFQWIGPLGKPKTISLYKLSSRNDISVKTLEDAKKYNVGVTRGTMNHEFLKSNGFSVGINMSVVTRLEQNIHKLFSGRVDLILFLKSNIDYAMSPFDMKIDDLEEVALVFKTTPYMAFSKNTSTDLYEDTVQSYRQLVLDGVIDRFE